MWFAQTQDIQPINLDDSYYIEPVTTDSSIVGAFFAVYFIALAVVYVLLVIALWKIFVKAGQPGWKALIPFYNYWTLCVIVGKPGWWSLLGFIPFVGWIGAIVVSILVGLELGKAFAKSTIFSVFGLVLFPFIGYLILGYGSSSYDKNRLGNDSGMGGNMPTAGPASAPPVAS
jgi:uncharacterized membrane protein YhaH (DUF805 family)